MAALMRRSISKRALFVALGSLRFFLITAAVAVILVEVIELLILKEVMHLTLFAIFFLICSFQVNLSKHESVLISEERVSRLFILALFSLAASLLELVDLGFDQLAANLQNNPLHVGGYLSVCLLESAVGIIAILLMTYSIDQMLVTLRSAALDHRWQKLES